MPQYLELVDKQKLGDVLKIAAHNSGDFYWKKITYLLALNLTDPGDGDFGLQILSIGHEKDRCKRYVLIMDALQRATYCHAIKRLISSIQAYANQENPDETCWARTFQLALQVSHIHT